MRYRPIGDSTDDRIYNRAGLDHSKVIWAWAKGTADNLELMRYYPDRNARLAEPDTNPVTLAGRSHKRRVPIALDFPRRPYGAPGYLTAFPALKRWANKHCAYGARRPDSPKYCAYGAKRLEPVRLRITRYAIALVTLVPYPAPAPTVAGGARFSASGS